MGDGGDANFGQPERTKNELAAPPAVDPVEPLKDGEEIKPIGVVMSCFGTNVSE